MNSACICSNYIHFSFRSFIFRRLWDLHNKIPAYITPMLEAFIQR